VEKGQSGARRDSSQMLQDKPAGLQARNVSRVARVIGMVVRSGRGRDAEKGRTVSPGARITTDATGAPWQSGATCARPHEGQGATSTLACGSGETSIKAIRAIDGRNVSSFTNRQHAPALHWFPNHAPTMRHGPKMRLATSTLCRAVTVRASNGESVLGSENRPPARCRDGCDGLLRLFTASKVHFFMPIKANRSDCRTFPAECC
jgi:hypothetical protein